VPGRAAEPIFPPAAARYGRVSTLHRDVLSALQGVASPAGSPERAAAVGALSLMARMLRRFDQVGDLSNEGRRRMPAMMRGADSLHLAVTRRNLDTVEKAAAALAAAPVQMTAEEQMLAMITFFQPQASRHTEIATEGGSTLDQRFANPPLVIEHLQRGIVQGDDAPPDLLGQPLVIPGNPGGSPFVRLIESAGHPMNFRLSQVVPPVGKTGFAIVREWIASLP
jgi:hypothetical protein